MKFAVGCLLVIGAITIAAGVASADPSGTFVGSLIYLAGLHWPPGPGATNDERPGW